MSAQSRKRLKKRTAKKFAPIFFVLLSVISLTLFGVYKAVNKSITSAFSSNSQDLSSQDVYSVLYIPNISNDSDRDEIGDLYFLIVNRGKSTVLSSKITSSATIDAYGRYGMETLSNVFTLGKKSSGDDLESGVDYLVKSLEYALGFQVDRYIYSEGESQKRLTDVFENNSADSVFGPKLLMETKSGIVTDFSSGEFLSLFDTLKSSDNSEISYNDIESEMRRFVYNSNISMENKAVVVLNGTKLPGIAGFGGRVCENAGMRVIEVGNASKVYEESVLIADEVDSLSAMYLARFFGISKVVSKENLSNYAEPAVDRADITLIIGLDIAEHL